MSFTRTIGRYPEGIALDFWCRALGVEENPPPFVLSNNPPCAHLLPSAERLRAGCWAGPHFQVEESGSIGGGTHFLHFHSPTPFEFPTLFRYESGSLYKPSAREHEVSLQPVSASDAARMGSIWNYWEGESDEEGPPVPDDLHPDHAPAA